MASKINQVAEMQGLYGPFTMAERVVQKIWLQRDFDQAKAVLTDGRSLEIRSTGVWNLLGGPDFRGARLRIGGREVVGDVEVHFRSGDWRAHGHGTDPAYDKVALHVVLFPLDLGEEPARHRRNELIPTLVLLPLLYRDLEEYSSDDTLETMTARDEWRYIAELSSRKPEELRALLVDKARERWRQKIYFAGLRIAKLGWSDALHHAALEILGYRRNRAAMLAVATEFPLEVWQGNVDVRAIFETKHRRWQLQGVRPANHPLHRLGQYKRWVDASPAWPDQVLSLFEGFWENASVELPTKIARRALRLCERRNALALAITNNSVSGSRLDNLVCDGLLPLLEAKSERDLFALWFHWFLGDVPDHIRRTLPKLGLADGQMQPICHGYARGLLGWFMECDARASG